MQLQFLGANRQVTGSRYCLTLPDRRLLIDCGLFQERPYLDRNWGPSPTPPERLRAVLLTHAHLDHCGLIPRLVRQGFAGRVYATRATRELAAIVLRDAAHIQEEDAAFKKKRHRKEGRRGKHPEVPLYDRRDAEAALPAFRSVAYDEPLELGGGWTATFRDAGHILGSAMLDLAGPGGDGPRRIVFSGDIGQRGRPRVRDPTVCPEADYVVMESTYGSRNHEPPEDIPERLAAIIRRAAERGGNVVVPVFAIERSQDMVYYLSRLVREGRIPPLPVYLDSPMAVDVTQVFRRHRECFDEDSWRLIEADEPPLRFPGLRLVRAVEQSKAINEQEGPSVIMATSGMCTAGRIKHHLRHNIERPECVILFVGYQARGTLGRRILDGEPHVRIHGRMHRVRATVEQLHGMSGHADRDGLLQWLASLRRPPRRVFLTHGEQAASRELAARIEARWGWPTAIPEYGETAELA